MKVTGRPKGLVHRLARTCATHSKAVPSFVAPLLFVAPLANNQGRLQCVRELLSRGADPAAEDHTGSTPLSAAHSRVSTFVGGPGLTLACTAAHRSARIPVLGGSLVIRCSLRAVAFLFCFYGCRFARREHRSLLCTIHGCVRTLSVYVPCNFPNAENRVLGPSRFMDSCFLLAWRFARTRNPESG